MFLVGRLTKNPEIQKVNGKDNCYITIAVKRPFKNPDGLYESDYIGCTIWSVIAERVCEFCKKGDLISLKGRIQNNNYTDKDNKKVYSYEIIGEQVSFLQSINKNVDEEIVESED